MSASFDPYHHWLAIPPAEQPPHFYRLLGVTAFEENLDVIANSADRQMKHLRGCQAGKHAEESQRLLTELAAAKVCLLDPQKKADYDAGLRVRLAAPAAAAQRPASGLSPPPLPAPAAPPPKAPRAMPPLTKAPPAVPPAAAEVRKTNDDANSFDRQRRARTTWLIVAAAGLAMLFGCAVGAGLWVALRASSRTVADKGGIAAAKAAPADPSPVPSDPVAAATPDPIDESSADADPDQPSDPPEVIDAAPPESSESSVWETAPDPSAEVPFIGPPLPPEDEPVDTDPPETAPVPPPKVAVPDQAVRDEQRQRIAKLFPLDQARTLHEKAQLAKELIRTAGETKDAAEQFALLNMAREQAADAGQIQLAAEAIDALAQRFTIDPVAVRVATVDQASKVTVPLPERREIVAFGLETIDQLIAQDHFERADALCARLLTTARVLRAADLVKVLGEQRRHSQTTAEAFESTKDARASLEESPDDAAANLVVGKYVSLVKRDWAAGAAYLVKGSDLALAEAARLELASSAPDADINKLAERWWDAAAKQADANEQKMCRARSAHWYRQMLDGLSGLEKKEADQRIAEAGDADAKPVSFADEFKRISAVNLLALIDVERHAVNGKFQVVKGALVTPPDNYASIRIPYSPPAEYRIDLVVEIAAQGGENLVVGLIKQEHQFLAVLNGYRGQTCGLSLVDGLGADRNETTLQRDVMLRGRLNQIVCLVTKDAVQVQCNGRPVVDWRGDAARLQVEPRFDVGDPRALLVGTSGSQLAIHSLVLTPISGSGTVLTDDPQPPEEVVVKKKRRR